MNVTSSILNYKGVNDTRELHFDFSTISSSFTRPRNGLNFFECKHRWRAAPVCPPVTAALEYLQHTWKTYHRECVCVWMNRTLFLFYPLSFFSGGLFRYTSLEIIFCPRVTSVVQKFFCVHLPFSLVSFQPFNLISPLHQYWVHGLFKAFNAFLNRQAVFFWIFFDTLTIIGTGFTWWAGVYGMSIQINS